MLDRGGGIRIWDLDKFMVYKELVEVFWVVDVDVDVFMVRSCGF